MKKALSLIHIEHIWSVLCSNAIVDQASQNVTLSNVLEQINVKKGDIPSQRKEGDKMFLPFPFQLVIFLRKLGKGVFEADIKSEILDPKGEVLSTAENPMILPEEKDRLRILAGYPGVPITVDGYYSVRTSLRAKGGQYEKISEVPLEVKFV